MLVRQNVVQIYMVFVLTKEVMKTVSLIKRDWEIKMKVAIYCRVSTQDQNANTQEVMCRKYCEFNGYEVYKVYTDVFTGTKISRPAFNQLLEDMRSYNFKCVMVTKLDRVGRSLQHLLSLFDEFNSKGIHFIATTQNIDTLTSVGRLQMQMIGAFAEYERNLISERTKEALKNKKNVGKRGKDKKPRKRRGVLKGPTFYSK